MTLTRRARVVAAYQVVNSRQNMDQPITNRWWAASREDSVTDIPGVPFPPRVELEFLGKTGTRGSRKKLLQYNSSTETLG